MKQIWPNYSYSPTTNVLTLTGLNIDRDQLLLVSAPEPGRIMYNFADSTTTASAFTAGANTGLTLVASTAGLTTTAALVIYYDDQLTSSTVTVSSLPAISGTVTANVFGLDQQDGTSNAKIPIISFDTGIEAGSGGYVVPVQISNTAGAIGASNALPISGTVTASLSAGTAQIGSVTASISGTVPISISSVTIGNSVTISSLPAISGTVTANVFGTNSIDQIPLNMTFQADGFANGNRLAVSIIDDQGAEYGTSSPLIVSGTVTVGNTVAIAGTVTANTFALQGTAVTTSNFTSTTASTVLANFNAGREVLTIFNEGAGNLHICAGATCTTIAYQVRLSSGDYYEAPNHQTTITHSAVFATAGTARVTEVS